MLTIWPTMLAISRSMLAISPLMLAISRSMLAISPLMLAISPLMCAIRRVQDVSRLGQAAFEPLPNFPRTSDRQYYSTNN